VRFNQPTVIAACMPSNKQPSCAATVLPRRLPLPYRRGSMLHSGTRPSGRRFVKVQMEKPMQGTAEVRKIALLSRIICRPSESKL
jgi:hypothetical protein